MVFSHKMKTTILVFALSVTTSFSQILSEWNFSSLTASQSRTNSTIVASSFSSLLLTSAPVAQRDSASQSGIAGTWSFNNSLTGNPPCFDFTLSPATALDLSSVTFAVSKSSPALVSYQFGLQAALNGSTNYQTIGSAILVTSSNSSAPQTLVFDTSAYTNLTGSISFRTYYIPATNPGTNVIFLGDTANNTVAGISVYGSAVPEAKAAALLTCGLILAACFNAVFGNKKEARSNSSS